MGRMSIIKEKKKKGDDIRTQRTEDKCHDRRIIRVQNAECEPDTSAYIIVQNEINYEPKVSIIIPVYNAEAYLRECLDSVVNQTLKEIEVICIDDGSTDSSLSILKEYAQKDSRVSVLQQRNLHAGVARNAGIAVARGEYVHFLDSDDWVDVNTYKELVTLMDGLCVEVLKFRSFSFDNQMKKIVSAYYTDMKALRENDFEKSYSFKRDYDILIRSSDVPWSGIYSRQFLLKNNVVFDNLICVNDTSFFYRCLVSAQNIHITKKRFVYHRINNPSSLIGIRAYHFDCQIRVFFTILDIIHASHLSIIKRVRESLIESVYFCYSIYVNNPHLEKNCKDKIRALVKDFNTHICRDEVKREYLVYFDDIQGRKPYLRVLFNWYKKHCLLKENKTLCIKHIQDQLRQTRIDIKNVGTAKNSVAIEAENSTVVEPGWFCNTQGRGQVLTSSAGRGKIKIHIISDGKLAINFLGPDVRFEGKRFPLWIDYRSIKIDGKEILSSPIAVWHDKPWSYQMSVKDGQEVWIEYEQQIHPYSRKELKETLLKLNPTLGVIHEDINALTDEIIKIISHAK